jgi:N6-adenosine-specific RNA methylase IME4
VKHLQKRSKNGVKSRPGRRQWAARINAAWRKSVGAVFETGRLLIAAKANLPHGAWEAMCANDLKFHPRIAQMLIAIACDRRLVKPKIFSLLPPAYTTIYQISQLKDKPLEARIADGTIKPSMTGREIVSYVQRERRAQREQELGIKQKALPDQKFGVIVADPEWADDSWSDITGRNRTADNHYPTSSTEEIAARDVASIAADDCVLFLWSTNQHLRHAITVLEAWGFNYVSNYCWGKDKISLGRWSRGKHELLLIGTVGSPPCPAPGTQRESLIFARKSKKHSEKPEIFLEMIEQYFPNLPKIELNRRGKARPGWSAWGNEAE